MEKANRIAALVRKLETVTKLPAGARLALSDLPLAIKRYESDQTLIPEGSHIKQCCLIVEGLACRYKIVRSGERQILSLHIPGDMPDLHTLLIDVMDHSLGALTPVVAAFIPHGAIRRITRQHYELAEAFQRETLVEAAIFREWIVGVGKRSALSRLAHLLCEFITKMEAVGLSDGITCVLPMTQTEIGDVLGLSNVHTNKQLRELRLNGLIEMQGRQLRVLDWRRLCKLGEFDATYLHLRQ